jgi:HSP20 family protein
MAVVVSSPDDLLQLQNVLDRFLRSPALSFEDVFGGVESGVFPPVNIFSDDEGLVVRAEVPGIKPGEIVVRVEHGALIISGERKRDERKGTTFYRRERPFGTFSRTIRLPDELDGGGAKAQCRSGMLTVRIPKQERAKPKKISITQ